MSQLRRRIRKLEAALTDGSGLVPRSPAWFQYWMNEYGKVMEDRNYPCGPIPLEAMTAWFQAQPNRDYLYDNEI